MEELISKETISNYLDCHTREQLNKELNDFVSEVTQLFKSIQSSFQKHKTVAAAADIAIFCSMTTDENGKVEPMAVCTYGSRRGLPKELFNFLSKVKCMEKS